MSDAPPGAALPIGASDVLEVDSFGPLDRPECGFFAWVRLTDGREALWTLDLAAQPGCMQRAGVL